MKADKLTKIPWKVTPCYTENCWCAGVQPVEEILDEDKEPSFIIHFGNVTKEFAQHIVECHNAFISSVKK